LIALDTNILVYAVEAGEPESKDVLARDLLARLGPVQPIVPLQVIGEFLNTCRRKKVIAIEMASNRAEEFLYAFRCPATAPADLLIASRLADAHRLQYFDALIVTVAARAGATMLLSEDMQDGLEAAGLRVVDPFVAENGALIEGVLGG
jgi:predicted nucleic acid-binding protein